MNLFNKFFEMRLSKPSKFFFLFANDIDCIFCRGCNVESTAKTECHHNSIYSDCKRRSSSLITTFRKQKLLFCVLQKMTKCKKKKRKIVWYELKLKTGFLFNTKKKKISRDNEVLSLGCMIFKMVLSPDTDASAWDKTRKKHAIIGYIFYLDSVVNGEDNVNNCVVVK